MQTCMVLRCVRIQEIPCLYYINITFPSQVIVENIIPRNVIINRGAAEVDNHISRDDIFDYHPRGEYNIYFIIPNRTRGSIRRRCSSGRYYKISVVHLWKFCMENSRDV